MAKVQSCTAQRDWPEVKHEHRWWVLQTVLLLTRNPWWTLTDFTYKPDTLSLALNSCLPVFLFFFVSVFPFLISNFSFSVICASLREPAPFRCHGHTYWAEYFIQLSSSSHRGCYCLTIGFAMIMNVAQSNSSLSILHLSQLNWLFPETCNLIPKQQC